MARLGNSSQGARPDPARHGVRRYRSPRRQEQGRQTRRRILAAATEQFREFGYSGTTMASVAGVAGVSVPTVELAFGTKAALLKAAIDVAIVGDDEPLPVLERAWVARAQAEAAPKEFLAVFAQELVGAAERSDALVLVAFEAARSDARLAPLANQLKAQRAVMAAWVVGELTARAPLLPGIDRQHAIDVIWLLMDPAVFDRLTADRDWTPARFGAWFADSALRLLVASQD
jgi:AcrR family transcriptional regulator